MTALHLCSLAALFGLISPISGHGNVSRHLLLDDLSMVVILADAEQTPGPFAEQDNDYVRDTNDLTLAGIAGSPPGLNRDRGSVVNGAKLQLTLSIYDVSRPSVAMELPNVEVFLWHTDAFGIYSAVGAGRSNGEDTDGQVWLRGIQTTDQDGKAVFHTILPGWYPGRAIHFHLRLRYPGATDFAATSQLYISDSDLAQYQGVEPYSFNRAPTTPLYADTIFARLNNPTIQEMLTLQMEGSVDTGFEANVNLGVVAPPGMVPLETNPPTAMPTRTPTQVPTNTATQDPTDQPTIATTSEPTTTPTQLEVPVPRPTFEFETPTSMAPSAAGPQGEEIAVVDEESGNDEEIQVLDDITTTNNNAATSASSKQCGSFCRLFLPLVLVPSLLL